MTNDTTEPKSTLAAAIEARPRALHVFPVSGFFGLGDAPILSVAVRVARKADEDAAVVAAHKHAAEATKVGGESAAAAARDIDLLGDAKVVEILYRTLRNEKDPRYAAFPSPGWMRSNIGTDQLAALMDLVREVRVKESPRPREIDDRAIEALVSLCGEHAADDIPEAVLAGYTREFLTHAFTLVCEKLRAARLSVDVLLEQRESAELDGALAFVKMIQEIPQLDGVDLADVLSVGLSFRQKLGIGTIEKMREAFASMHLEAKFIEPEASL